jgi:hypothetical protein
VRRGDFEHLVRRYLDMDLESRGFRLTPQPPADWEDEKPSAVYEADPDDFGERYPALDARAGGNVPCIDLWVHLDPVTGQISSELDGPSIETVMERFGVADLAQPISARMDTGTQLKRLAWRIAAVLDAAQG